MLRLHHRNAAFYMKNQPPPLHVYPNISVIRNSCIYLQVLQGTLNSIEKFKVSIFHMNMTFTFLVP